VPRTRGGWALSQLATAALLLVTLAIGYIAFVPRASRPASPVAAPPGDDMPGRPIADTLVEIVIAAGAVPAQPAFVSLYGVVAAPGAAATVDPTGHGPTPLGVEFDYVVAGSFGIRVAVPARLFRAGMMPEDVAAGVDVVLGPGDAIAFPDTERREIRNAGTTPLELIVGGVWGNYIGSSAPVFEVTAYKGDRQLLREWTEPAPRDLVLELRRLLLPPGESLPLPPTGDLRLLLVEPGRELALWTQPDGSLRNGDDEPVAITYLLVRQAGS
jgi:hypothetical protein